MQDENFNECYETAGAVIIRIVGNGGGFWKSNGGQIPVYINEGNIFAYKLCFTYFTGHHPDNGKKTHWVLEEIHLPHAYYNTSSKESSKVNFFIALLLLFTRLSNQKVKGIYELIKL